LENEQENLQGLRQEKLDTLTSYIIEFQHRGEVRPELNPQMTSYFIMTTASLPFIDKPEFFYGHGVRDNKQKYLEMVIESLYKALMF